MLIIDDSSRNHILKLLYSWLNEFSIPINPWSEVLFNIAINLFEKLLNANNSFEKNTEIWLQIFSAHDPIESKFLTKVFHGEPLNNGTHSLIFPIGGTIRIYGLNDTISTKNLTEIVYNLIYLIHSLYLETFIMRDNHVKLIISPASVNWTPLKNETISKMTKHSSDEKSTSSNIFFSWFKKISPNNYSIITSTTPSIFNENSVKKRFNPHQPTVSFDIRQGDPHRFFKLKLKIENALISSSPNCHFPYPVLLDRLEAEEDMLSITAYTSLRTQSLLAESKKGLEHLLLGTTSLKSFKMHQSITIGFTCFPIGCPDRPCLGPILSTIDYFKYQSPEDASTIFPNLDQSLSSIIRHWCSQRKINVYFSTEPHLMANDDNEIITWLSCQLCEANTIPTVLSREAGTYSFAKYLELTFYSTKFASPEPFCEHTMKRESGYRSLIVRCFMYNTIIVRFMHEDAKCYEVRLPRIQLTPVISEINTLTFSSPRMSIITLKEWKHKSAERDVGLFFQAIRAHLDLLQHYTIAEYKRKTRSQQDPNVAKHLQMEAHILDIEIKALSKRLDIDHEAMRNTLNNTNVNELNDFRRYFAIQSESIAGYLTDWQEEKCSELTDVCEWDRPDYISSKKIHCFPGSSVLVREDEPTSIIAYTLSSNDYLQELLHNDEPTEDNDGEYMHEKNLPYTKKRLSPTASTSSTPSIIDGYYSSIERKYISPSTGTTTETASFRTMITEVVKSSVAEVSLHHSRRLEDFKSRFWTKRQEETKLEKINEKELTRKLTEQFVHEGIEFTCIVYYAKEFENLRRQCDINQLMIQSLSRCRTWSATGGKSKNDRFVIKEMMNAWNMAEKDAFLKFAPKYFQHMKKSVDTPSVLAKIFGFFTIRMKNVIDKKTIFNLDVLVMEHLFFNQKITKRFDFKGIQDRQTYEVCKQQNDTTLWDGDWLDVGIDQERFEMSVGIVGKYKISILFHFFFFFNLACSG
ncbi:MAG: hypothetical protein EXX96DRAFT_475244 [Benjaminiella poitrasii]|nr:MAG: hypothetical protein EXX96DRAFT_475244 [Benjaminiella poitrasii]